MGTTGAPGVLRCSAPQLIVVLFGGSGAAGTAITGIGIDNKSATPCWLSGRPKVSFFTTGKSGKYMRLSVELGYGDPQKLFPLVLLWSFCTRESRSPTYLVAPTPPLVQES